MVEVKYKQHNDSLLMELKDSVLINFNDLFSQVGMVYLVTKTDCVYRMLMIWEIKYLKKLMVPNILFILVPQKCVVILDRSIGGMVLKVHSRA